MPDTPETPPTAPPSADAILNAQVDAILTSWPPEARAADPGPADATARFRWMESLRPAVERPSAPAAPATSAPGVQYPFQRGTDVAW